MAKNHTFLAMLTGAALAGGLMYYLKNSEKPAPCEGDELNPEGESGSWRSTFTIDGEDASEVKEKLVQETTKALGNFKDEAKKLSEEFGASLKKTLAEVKSAVEEAKKTAARKAEEAAEAAEEACQCQKEGEEGECCAEKAKKKIKETAEELKDSAEELKEAVKDSAKDLAEELEEAVKD